MPRKRWTPWTPVIRKKKWLLGLERKKTCCSASWYQASHWPVRKSRPRTTVAASEGGARGGGGRGGGGAGGNHSSMASKVWNILRRAISAVTELRMRIAVLSQR